MSSPMVVKSQRERLWANGFRPVAVLTGEKRPSGNAWPDRARMDPPEAVTQWPDTAALSTGILCDGLIALDIDVNDPSIVGIIVSAANHFLGTAPSRTRLDSARILLLYRADEGEPSKRSVNGPNGKVEALGRGQQFVALGAHPSGAAYEWPQGAPDSFHISKLTQVRPDALTAFFDAVAPHIGAEAPARPASPRQTPTAPTVATERDTAYAARALADEVAKLSAIAPGGGRNAALNASAHSLGTLVNGSIDAASVAYALLEASKINGHTAKHGESQTKATIESGLNTGISKPRPLLADSDISPMDLSGILPSKRSATKGSSKRSVALLQGANIEAKPIEWLWDGFLPRGKLTLLAGAGGTGKSTIAFSMAATITTGGIWPDGSPYTIPGNVLIWSSEDDPADTIKPRLMAVGADANRYGVITGTIDETGQRDAFDPARDMDSLRDAIAQIGGIALLIIDPIVTAVTGDMHRANDVRRSLQIIVDFAAEQNCAVLGITHFAKGTAGTNAADRVIGSQAFAALARMVLVAAKEEESNRRVFTRAKSNNSVDTGGFSYGIEATSLQHGIIATRIVWGEPLEGSSRDILATVESDEKDDSSQLGRAKHFLLQRLSNGPSPSKELMEHAREAHNVSAITLRRAKDELGIIARKAGMSAGWLWELPLDVPAMLRAQAAKIETPMNIFAG